MLAEHCVHMGILETAVGDHRLGPAARRVLLGGLEHQFHLSGKLVPDLIQHIGSPQEHGSVGVVSAGVHHPRVFGGEGHSCALCDGKRVKIRPESHALSFSFSFDHRRDAVSPNVLLRGKSHLLQGLRDIGGSILLMMAEFRMRVQIIPVLLHLVPVLLHQCADPFLIHISVPPVCNSLQVPCVTSV